MVYRAVLVLVLLALGVTAGADGAQPATVTGADALDEALALAGLQRQDLGWAPKGWWPRFPADIPYKLRAFDSLFNEPLDNIAYARSLAHAAKTHLDPATLDEDAGRNCTNLYLAANRLGINPKFGGLRGYTTNLTAKDTPLDEAILAIYEAAGRTSYAYTFSMELPYPKPAEELAKRVAVVPESARPVLGKLIINIIDARRWADVAFRNVPAQQRLEVSRRFNLGEEQVDAWDYCPAIDDVARTWDEASLWYASEKCVQALDQARIALKQVKDAPAFSFDWETPWGWVRIRGTGSDQVDGTDALLIVDLGGDDLYRGAVAAADAQRPIGLVLDCGGNDKYESTVPAQGAGLCGIGVLLDAGGDDVYQAERYAQGVGQFGFGLCADLAGDDNYFVKFSGQGCGYFGVGQLFDAAGDDQYRLYADGQGLGGVSGVGVLADRTGNDSYEAVRDAGITGRPSYHSPDDNISVNNAQGCAMGRRGDGADGHCYAGGLGVLLDSEGDDQYLSGNWAMGTGYWFGVGMLHDGAGNDCYRGVCYTQATGAHFCIGVLIDEDGNDLHLAEANSNMSCAWGHDFTIALLLDVGGNDVYDVQDCGVSYSINRSVTALIDIGGDDHYLGKAGHYPGYVLYDKRFAARGGVSDYFADTTSLGLFLDIGGDDTYATQPPEKTQNREKPGEEAEAPGPFGGANDTVWIDERDSESFLTRNFSIGVDRDAGTIDFQPRPEKTPSGRNSE